MTKYKAVQSPEWRLKDGVKGLPARVSFYGALPSPREAYELVHKPSIEINDGGRITYSNYFYGKIGFETFAEAEATAARLNRDLAERMRR